MTSPFDSNKPLDLYRANLGFALRLAALLQESRQRSRQLEAQAADSTIALLRTAAQTVESAQDWNALSGSPANLVRDQAQLMAKFWEGWFGIALQNGNSLQAGLDDALKHWQSDAGLTAGANPLAPPPAAANPFFNAFLNAANSAPAGSAPTVSSVTAAWSNAPGLKEFSTQIDRFMQAMSSAWTPSVTPAEPVAAEAAPESSPAKPNSARRGERHAE